MYLQGYICFEGEGDVVQLIVCPDWLNKKKEKKRTWGGGTKSEPCFTPGLTTQENNYFLFLSPFPLFFFLPAVAVTHWALSYVSRI